MPFPYRISTCKWLCSRFRGGRRKINLAWSGVKRGWGHSWCCKEDRAWWSEVVVSPKMEKKRGKVWPADEKKKSGEKCFFANFAHWFFHTQVIKFTSIYTEWKKVILSSLGKNSALWFGWKEFQPLVQSIYHELLYLTVQGYLSWSL